MKIFSIESAIILKNIYGERYPKSIHPKTRAKDNNKMFDDTWYYCVQGVGFNLTFFL